MPERVPERVRDRRKRRPMRPMKRTNDAVAADDGEDEDAAALHQLFD